MLPTFLTASKKIKLAGSEDPAFAKRAHSYAEYARAAYNRPPLLNALPALIAFVSLLGNILIYFLAATTNVTYDNYMAFTAPFGPTVTPYKRARVRCGPRGAGVCLGTAILLKYTNNYFVILLNLPILVLVILVNLTKDGGWPCRYDVLLHNRSSNGRNDPITPSS